MVFFCSNEDDLEVIPSSNPSSQMEIADNKLCKIKTDLCCEEFCLDDISKSFFPEGKLEEPLCDDFLYRCKNQLPTISTLLSRLKPQHVIDPFTSEDGKPLCEATILRYKYYFFILRVFFCLGVKFPALVFKTDHFEGYVC